MGHEVKTGKDLNSNGRSRRYLYFEKPRVLWIGDLEEETHTQILEMSGISPKRLMLAGLILVADNIVTVGGSGSNGLVPGETIKAGDPQVVVKYIQSLPDCNSREILVV